MRVVRKTLLGMVFLTMQPLAPLVAQVQIVGVPDYSWFAGCFGTASGNLFGYWDRHGLPDFYTGPTAGGVAPLNDAGGVGIRSMWASKAGFDGRPANQPGHLDDHWKYYSSESVYSYESTEADPYVTAGHAEHAPDCLGDFLGLSQKKWTNMNGECDGNIDGYGFVYWDKTGNKRVNYTPPSQGNAAVRDIQSGLREWTRYRGYEGDVFTQLAAEINPECPPGQGFTFDDLKAEIDAGYPVLIMLQAPNDPYRQVGNMPRANPEIHGVLAYGYDVWYDIPKVYLRFSWGTGEVIQTWSSDSWIDWTYLPVRGVIGYHPRPKIKSVTRQGAELRLDWEGPASQVFNAASGETTSVHRCQVEWSSSLNPAKFNPVGAVTTAAHASVPAAPGFYRISLLPRQ